MAAPQWTGGKCKTVQQVKAWFRHNTNDRRMEAQHTNPHINTRLTYLNFSVKGLSYRERCAAYDKRMGEIDQGKAGSGKNARTIMQSVIVYPPTALLDDKTKLREWFMKAGEVAEARFGQNMIDMAVDFDEVHEYRDKTGQLVTSREHGHLWLVPEVDGKLNGKQFSSRAVINGFNAELQAMSIREFGVPMMDGSGKKGGKKVELLKAESEGREIIAKAQEEAQKAVEAAQAQAREIIAKAQEKAQEEAQKAIAEASKELEEDKADVEQMRDKFRAEQKQWDDKLSKMISKYQVMEEEAYNKRLQARQDAEKIKTDMEMAAAILDNIKSLKAELTEPQRQRLIALEAQRKQRADQAEATLKIQVQKPESDEPSPV